MNLQKTKILRMLSKGILVLTGLFLLGFLGWTVYRGVKFRPYKVRVTNVTDSAFTVSWVTDSPMSGIVYYGEKSTFLPGPLAWLGKKKAVDDRDFSDAQSECVSKFNEEASKNKDENFTIDASGFDCNDIKVWKYGKYYTHHVTVQNLEAEKEYFFRVGDGVLSYGKNSGEFVVGEIEGVGDFSTKTSPLFSEVLAPNPAFGTTETVYQTLDGYYSYEKEYDSMVFLFIKDPDGLSFPILSSVANKDGGWSMDLANLRDEQGNPVSIEGNSMLFMPQSKNHRAFVFQEFEYGEVVFPIRLPGNTEEDVKKQDVTLSTQLLTKLVGKTEANYNDVGCVGTGNYGRLTYCGDQCYREWKRGSEVCGWEKVSSGCSSKPCTCPGESCNPPAPTPPIPPEPSCPNTGAQTLTNFTTTCQRNTCNCPASAASATVTCGNKCMEKKITCPDTGPEALPNFTTTCFRDTCSCPPNSTTTNVTCGKTCTRKTSTCPNTGSQTLTNFTTTCQRNTCNCPASAVSATVPCGNKCIKKEETTCPSNWGTWKVTTGDTKCENLPSQCIKNQCTPLCYTEGVCKTLITPAVCANTGPTSISDFTTVCNRATCSCTNSLAKSSTVTCGGKCQEKECGGTWGTWTVTTVNGVKSCQNNPTYCTPCKALCYTKAICDDHLPSTPQPNPSPSPSPSPSPTPSQCYYWSGGLIADGSCNAVVTPATGCVGKNYFTEATCGGQAGYYTYNILKLSTQCHPTGPISLSWTSFSACEAARKQQIKERDWFQVRVIDLAVILGKTGHINYEGENYVCCPYSKNGDSIVTNKNLTTVSNCVGMMSIKEQEGGGKSQLLDIKECTGLPTSMNDSNFFDKLSFSSEAKEENSDVILYLPESGIYSVKISKSEIPLSLPGGEDKKYLFFESRNGVDGYQAPIDPNNPKDNEDIIISQAAVVISTSQETTAKEMALKRGINIISFNFLPSAANEEKKMNSSEFLKLVNESDFNISRISYFAAGQWNGGTSYDIENNETKGVPFDLVFGKGYVVVAEQDCTISIPGYNIESPVPIAFSSGWNLVGVHGQKEAYTAKTFIESINTIEGLKANNVSWWPTSRGMYQGYQLQNGQEYGQDFPISPINGYFVRIAEFTPKEDTCKSLIWNPSGEMNGECGSNN
ncbi:MAG TPA: fibronectin type III domain-containing protein [Candidatus Dojkabacteria bacterium]|nr:fibronectin type III domain-containing protein [Candidatus Dojkabacteria bacterium]HRZ84684.1 fibronectin type III domain-containing protein [Candidatus Dojkabacteria bacterium]